MLDKTIQPLGDRVVIKKPEAETNKGKIIITENVGRGTAVFGEVLAVGPGLYSQNGELIPMTVCVGDTVMYRKDMAGDSLKIDGEEYLIFREHDLIMVKRRY